MLSLQIKNLEGFPHDRTKKQSFAWYKPGNNSEPAG
jgi:hypothetical protein